MDSNFVKWVAEMNALLQELSSARDDAVIQVSMDVSFKVLELLTSENVDDAETIIGERILTLPNSERQDGWFQNHPWMAGAKSAFDLFDGHTSKIQAKFYWLRKRSSSNLVGAVHFTPNWEDHDYTRNENFKVGLDFFLTSDADGVIVALSNRGKVRVMELNSKLSNTQVQVLQNWWGLESLPLEELHAQIWESFRLEEVNSRFYRGVSDAFVQLHDSLVKQGRPEEDAKMFASRLLGRLIFVWFLRKMNLIDSSIGYFDTSKDSGDYYRKALERLFFRTLNSRVDDRLSESNQIDLTTPYLNGGLFSPRADDWYGDDSLAFPQDFFVDLYAHFDNFNFTTDESTPEYEQVAIDPEMLGRVFESLLASQIDETGEQARKAKGAFYTPREIVSQMCRESIREYLHSVLAGDARASTAVAKLVDTPDHEWAINGSNSKRDIPLDLQGKISEALQAIKTIDPACGSGAFPLGLLQLLSKIHLRLDSRLDNYKLKLSILRENIFGVDIEPMAVEISRLRSWLSLIVEEQGRKDIQPLPNLDFNFVCANSLVRLKDETLFTDSSLQQTLAELRANYFSENNSETKSQIQRKYLQAISPDLFDDGLDERAGQLKSYNPFDSESVATFFDAEYMFGLGSGFDVIVGNPPYVDSENMTRNSPRLREYLRENYRTTRGNWDLFVPFIELALDIATPNGVVSLIVKNSLLGAPYASIVRSELSNNGLLTVWDFGGVSVFESAAVDTCVFLASKAKVATGMEFISMKTVDSERYRSKCEQSELSTASSWVPFVVSPSIKILLDKFKVMPNLADKKFFASAAATVGEAYKISEFVNELEPGESNVLKMVNTGSIDPFTTFWGVRSTRYLGSDYLRPVVAETHLGAISRRRLEQAKRRKIIVIGMGNVEAFLDSEGTYLAGKTTSIIWKEDQSDVNEFLVALGLLNSTVARFWFKYMFLNAGFAGIRPADLLTLPVPELAPKQLQQMCDLVTACISSSSTENLHELNEFVLDLYQIKPEEVEIVR